MKVNVFYKIARNLCSIPDVLHGNLCSIPFELHKMGSILPKKASILEPKEAQVRETPSADDAIPGDLPDVPMGITFGPAPGKMDPNIIIRRLLMEMRNKPVIERHPTTGDVFES